MFTNYTKGWDCYICRLERGLAFIKSRCKSITFSDAGFRPPGTEDNAVLLRQGWQTTYSS